MSAKNLLFRHVGQTAMFKVVSQRLPMTCFRLVHNCRSQSCYSLLQAGLGRCSVMSASNPTNSVNGNYGMYGNRASCEIICEQCILCRKMHSMSLMWLTNSLERAYMETNFSTQSIVQGLSVNRVSPIDVVQVRRMSKYVMKRDLEWRRKQLSVETLIAGDVEKTFGPLDLNKPKLGFDKVPELESASESVKKIFSLSFGDRRALVDRVVQDLLEKVKDHPADLQELEVLIAKETVLVRNQAQICETIPSKRNRYKLRDYVNQRQVWMRELRALDIEKFEWLMRELRIRYVPPDPEVTDDGWLPKIARRKQAAVDAAEAVRTKKLTTIQAELAAARKKFEVERDRELDTIEAEMKALGVADKLPASLSEALALLGAAHLTPKRQEYVSREELVWQRRCAQLMELKKEADRQILEAHGFVP